MLPRASFPLAALLAPAAPAQAKAPSRLLVEATEFRFTLSRTTLAPGHAIVQLADNGEDPHDLHLVRLDKRGHAAGKPDAIPQTLPGAVATWQGTLKPGRYKLFCSLPGHEKAGMRAILVVR
jgi:uncharacterized cupredoxin-like copper-binding protein